MATLSNDAKKNALALGAFDTKADLYCFEIARPDVGPNDVAIAIQYCGMCHSDCHACNGDWGLNSWPIAPGHEVCFISRVPMSQEWSARMSTECVGI